MNDSTLLTTMAGTARARIEDALKSTVERELLLEDLDTAVGHSRFEHVVTLIHDADAADREDELLASSLLGSDSEAQIKAFAERLATPQI